jgi:hypothetical protein
MFWGKNPIEKAVDVVGNVADKGMKIWDSSDFTAQERGKLFVELLEATKSQATSISRRHLLWFVMSLTGLSIVAAMVYNHLGMTEELQGLKDIIETWKVGYAFVSALSFYYFAHIVRSK